MQWTISTNDYNDKADKDLVEKFDCRTTCWTISHIKILDIYKYHFAFLNLWRNIDKRDRAIVWNQNEWNILLHSANI